MKTTTSAFAPGKLILSGEHAVVYGAPALALAIDKGVHCEAKPNNTDLISINIPNFKTEIKRTYSEINQLREQLNHKYHQFKEGDLSISKILDHPTQLIEYAISMVLHEAKKPIEGFDINLLSHLPIGCGLGSSAAFSVAVLRALSKFLGLELSDEQLFEKALETENLQHGNSSGIDPSISIHGGAIRYQNKQLTSLELPQFPMQLVLTGQPESTTGECVEYVSRYAKDTKLWQEFIEVEQAVENAIISKNHLALIDAVRHNHKLLGKICVVPEHILNFISEIERYGFAGKICGAGSVVGKNAGIIWIVADKLPELYKDYGWHKFS